MIHSMTAFASSTGTQGANSWAWEVRGVNARGLDLRLRIPEGLEGVEAKVRKALSDALSRGNVTLNLRLTRQEGTQSLSVNAPQLDAVLSALDAVQERAFEMGVTLAQPNAADVLAQRGVLTQDTSDVDDTALIAAISSEIAPLITAFVDMRASEGAALYNVITAQLNEIADLIAQADAAATARRPQVKAKLTADMGRILEDIAEVDEGRIAQELALLAVKSDVTEEIDRLKAHVAAAKGLLSDPKPAGRKLDFLAQEFNREANTLCAKAGAPNLTAIGLDLKAVIDQMREQIQNVE
ncbi:MAG: YicC family protein [Yoonia sp.]|nr:YicC family protein [Yoonia sp.]